MLIYYKHDLLDLIIYMSSFSRIPFNYLQEISKQTHLLVLYIKRWAMSSLWTDTGEENQSGNGQGERGNSQGTINNWWSILGLRAWHSLLIKANAIVPYAALPRIASLSDCGGDRGTEGQASSPHLHDSRL